MGMESMMKGENLIVLIIVVLIVLAAIFAWTKMRDCDEEDSSSSEDEEDKCKYLLWIAGAVLAGLLLWWLLQCWCKSKDGHHGHHGHHDKQVISQSVDVNSIASSMRNGVSASLPATQVIPPASAATGTFTPLASVAQSAASQAASAGTGSLSNSVRSVLGNSVVTNIQSLNPFTGVTSGSV